MSKIKDALDSINLILEQIGEEDEDKLELLNNDANYADLMEWALLKHNEAKSQAEGCKNLADAYTVRKKAFEGKAEGMKNICQLLMGAAKEESYKGIAGTASIRKGSQSVNITDEGAVPSQFTKMTITADKNKIKAALKKGEEVLGCELVTGKDSVTIRVK